ncbi:MAG: sugar phosphate isomerase/epimerase [Verrucomicrobia subdivision 3 bacterium]|nr:sugar phosphate isomerase/epimerase [Limisphaerales bacterium]
MKLGFVSAILPEFTLDEVLRFAAECGFAAVELMCWPPGKAERRYAGVTHLDVTALDNAAVQRVRSAVKQHGVSISALGYYPNPLCASEAEAAIYITHLKKVIIAAQNLGVNQVNTFVGRDHSRSVADNWKVFDERWPGIVKHAEACAVRIGIENCPMLFTVDEWPGGKNLATSPKIWRIMFERIPSRNFGLNYDPSHLLWQFIDPLGPIREFADRIFHVHAKDASVDRARLNDVGILATPLEFHAPRLPGLGDLDWGEFLRALKNIGYAGPVCIEVEDRAFEGAVADRQRALIQSKRYLEKFLNQL